MMQSKLKWLVAGVGIGVVVGLGANVVGPVVAGAAAASASELAPDVTPRGALRTDEQAIVNLFDRVQGSVVYITTLDQHADIFSGTVREFRKGTGTGFLWDDAGHIVTNYHVWRGARRVTVVLADQSVHDAEFVGSSPQHDLAVLRITPPPGLAPVDIGDSESLRVGQSVYAIGNPFGLNATLSSGLLSALDRQIESVSGHQIEGVIQIDAAINSGNSGGPLLDSAGRVIGVNTAIATTTGTSAGIGFAIPIDTVYRVVPHLIATGEYHPPRLGFVTRATISDSVVRRLGTTGVLVLDVEPESGAAEAGFRPARRQGDRFIPGDVIQAIEDRPVASLLELQTVLDRYAPGDVVQVTLWREGQTTEVEVRLS